VLATIRCKLILIFLFLAKQRLYCVATWRVHVVAREGNLGCFYFSVATLPWRKAPATLS